MALILNIDTATDNASVCLTKDGKLLALESNSNQKDHASFIQPAIQKLLVAADEQLNAIDAVAVSNGPGSYTGLRVGLSTAKGICYALNKPLLLVNTLAIMATAAVRSCDQSKHNTSLPLLFCPMIDARRMEVFAAVYDASLNEIVAPAAFILTEDSFSALLQQHEIYFSGNGSEKFKAVVTTNNAHFLEVKHTAFHMATIAEEMYVLKSFTDLAYSEPFYLKEFFTPQQKIKSD